MKKLSDEELQRFVESKQNTPEGLLSDDAKAYHTLFEALEREPENGLPYDFAANVTRQVQAQQKHSSEFKYNIIAFIIFLGAIVGLYAAVALFDPGAADAILKYKWILLLLPAVFIAIQYFDQKMVKAKLFREIH